MLAKGVILLLFMVVEIRGVCRFATQFHRKQNQRDQNQGLCPDQHGLTQKCALSRYRTYNGSCNNFDHPDWGMAYMPFNRLMPAQYEDGVEAMRWKSVTGGPLPNARDISLALNTEDPTGDESPVFNFMQVAVGQFLDQDLTLMNNGDNITGCGTQFCERRGECDPLQLPLGDPDYKHAPCLEFTRSKPVYCGHVRDQTNTQTSYIDLSMLYGTNKHEVSERRDLYNRGQLKTIPHPFDLNLKRLLPPQHRSNCRRTGGDVKCFAGDSRVNGAVSVMSMYTLFTRAHNTIENKLHYLNPHWSGDKLYQESKKLLSAIWQRIIYNEYLPKLMGPDASYKYDLILEEGYKYWGGYNPHDKQAVYSEFTAGAYRFGHSQIPNKFRFTDMLFHDFKEDFVSLHILRPGALYATDLMGGSGVDAVLRGMLDKPALRPSLSYAKQMTANLRTEHPPFGEGIFELATLDIQRARDHGLKPYNALRRFCGLKSAQSFEDLPDIPHSSRMRLQSIYKDVEDIDLVAGGLAEEHLFGSLVGPTFNCILGEQLTKVRSGDRFWHETPDKLAGFTPDQLKEIRKYSMAYLVCENGDKINMIQPNVMMQPLHDVPSHYRAKYGKLLNHLYRDGPNTRISCHDFHIPDLSPWKDDEGHGNGYDN